MKTIFYTYKATGGKIVPCFARKSESELRASFAGSRTPIVEIVPSDRESLTKFQKKIATSIRRTKCEHTAFSLNQVAKELGAELA